MFVGKKEQIEKEEDIIWLYCNNTTKIRYKCKDPLLIERIQQKNGKRNQPF